MNTTGAGSGTATNKRTSGANVSIVERWKSIVGTPSVSNLPTNPAKRRAFAIGSVGLYPGTSSSEMKNVAGNTKVTMASKNANSTLPAPSTGAAATTTSSTGGRRRRMTRKRMTRKRVTRKRSTRGRR